MLLIRTALGLLFLAAGAAKLAEPNQFRALVSGLGLLGPPWADLYAAASPGLDLAIGITCLLGWATRAAGLAAALALTGYAAHAWVAVGLASRASWAGPEGLLGRQIILVVGALSLVACSLVLVRAGGGPYSVDALRAHRATAPAKRPRLSRIAIGLLTVNLLAALVLAGQVRERTLQQTRAAERIAAACGAVVGPEAASKPHSASAPAAPLRQFGPGSPPIRLEPLAVIEQPVYLTDAGDRSGRLFVVSRHGRIVVLRDGRVSSRPFLDLSALVSTDGPEQGLLSVAFHPRYATNGHFYVNYTDRNGIGNTVVARYQVSSDDPEQADPTSATTVLYVEQPYPNHNGGLVRFGPDGFLYVGLGDGGSGGDPQGYAQDRGVLLGKLLRIDVDHGEPYAIPTENPFVDEPGTRPEIWSYGLRNPWRFAFDRATGDLYIADVGQTAWEWVHYQPAGLGGQNFGWNCVEGSHCYPPGRHCDPSGFIQPIAEYSHHLGCSVTGGQVYRGTRFPRLGGLYLYGDFCSGRIWALERQPSGDWRSEQLLDTDLAISSFGEDEDGELYLTDLGGGIYRLLAEP